MDRYAVYFGNEKIGDATVVKQGLYYKIACLCQFSGAVPFRIIVKNDREVDLGLCVPMESGFGLSVCIPISKFGRGALHFTAVPKHTQTSANCIAVSPDEPFHYIEKLKDAYLVSRGMIALGITQRSPNLQDNDPNP